MDASKISSSNEEQEATSTYAWITIVLDERLVSSAVFYLLHRQCLQVSDCETTRRQVLFRKVRFWFSRQNLATTFGTSAMIICIATMCIACSPVHTIISGLAWSHFKLLQNAMHHFVICVMAIQSGTKPVISHVFSWYLSKKLTSWRVCE